MDATHSHPASNHHYHKDHAAGDQRVTCMHYEPQHAKASRHHSELVPGACDSWEDDCDSLTAVLPSGCPASKKQASPAAASATGHHPATPGITKTHRATERPAVHRHSADDGERKTEEDAHRAASSRPAEPAADAASTTLATLTDADGNLITNWTGKVLSFDDMPVREELMRGIYSLGFEKPSAIQQTATVPVVQGRDTIAQAQAGTGKTGAFSLASLERVDESLPVTQVLVLAPTRDLAVQTASVMKSMALYTDIHVLCCTGGTSINADRDDMRAGKAHIVVGTPGRIQQMIDRRYLRLADVKLVVLDEADRMLDARGFRGQTYDIFQDLPQDVQVALFSATFTADTLADAAKILRNPAVILVKREKLTLDALKQFRVDCGDRGDKWAKLDTLVELYSFLTVGQAIIFVNHRDAAKWLTQEMAARDFPVTAFHADLDAADRVAVMKDFRAGRARVLIATDIIARGIDVQGVSLVINFDLPTDPEEYLHRIGRSARYGRKGVAISLSGGHRDPRVLAALERHYCTEIGDMPMDVSKYM